MHSELVHRFAAGGYVGRGSGRGVDVRRLPGYPPYDALDFEVPVLVDGDVHSRVLVRFREVTASIELIRQILRGLPEGPIAVPVPARPGEGISLVESFRGDILDCVPLHDAARTGRQQRRRWPSTGRRGTSRRSAWRWSSSSARDRRGG